MYPYRNQQIPAPFQKNIITTTTAPTSSPTVSIQKNHSSTLNQQNAPSNTSYNMNPKMALLSVLLLDQFLF